MVAVWCVLGADDRILRLGSPLCAGARGMVLSVCYGWSDSVWGWHDRIFQHTIPKSRGAAITMKPKEGQQEKDLEELERARTDTTRHHCRLRGAYGEYGSALTECFEKDDGALWVTNEEFFSSVNFCPQCGYMAKKLQEMSDEERVAWLFNGDSEHADAASPTP